MSPLIAFSAQIKQGVGLQSLMTFTVGIIPLLILIASFFNKESRWKITSFDLICGALSLIGLALWYVTKVGNIAIIFGIMADGLAGLPTIVKSYQYPETESASAYLSGVVNAGITLLTIDVWSFSYFGFPLYIFLIDIVIFSLVQFELGKKWSARI